MEAWTTKLIRERDAELMVALDRILEAGWDERHLYMRYAPAGRSGTGQVASVMLRACTLWTSDVELFRVTWQFDDTGNNVVITPLWLQPVPECPTSLLRRHDAADEPPAGAEPAAPGA